MILRGSPKKERRQRGRENERKSLLREFVNIRANKEKSGEIDPGMILTDDSLAFKGLEAKTCMAGREVCKAREALLAAESKKCRKNMWRMLVSEKSDTLTEGKWQARNTLISLVHSPRRWCFLVNSLLKKHTSATLLIQDTY